MCGQADQASGAGGVGGLTQSATRPHKGRVARRNLDKAMARILALDCDHTGPRRASKRPLDIARPVATTRHGAVLREQRAIKVEHLDVAVEREDRPAQVVVELAVELSAFLGE